MIDEWIDNWHWMEGLTHVMFIPGSRLSGSPCTPGGFCSGLRSENLPIYG